MRRLRLVEMRTGEQPEDQDQHNEDCPGWGIGHVSRSRAMALVARLRTVEAALSAGVEGLPVLKFTGQRDLDRSQEIGMRGSCT
jgi:hypothetical protein